METAFIQWRFIYVDKYRLDAQVWTAHGWKTVGFMWRGVWEWVDEDCEAPTSLLQDAYEFLSRLDHAVVSVS